MQLKKKLKFAMLMFPNGKLDTIFFGGGSPSLLKGHQIEKIISALSKKYDLTNIIESSIEVNPGEVSLETLNYINNLE